MTQVTPIDLSPRSVRCEETCPRPPLDWIPRSVGSTLGAEASRSMADGLVDLARGDVGSARMHFALAGLYGDFATNALEMGS